MSQSHLNQLANAYALKALTPNELQDFMEFLEYEEYNKNELIVREKDKNRDLYFILEGESQISRSNLDLGSISAGVNFGELSLITGQPRSASVIARSKVRVAKLGYENYQKLYQEKPLLASKFMEAMVRVIRKEIIDLTDNVELLLEQRSLPRQVNVLVRINNEVKKIKMGTPLHEILPKTINEQPVIAAFINNKPVPLLSPVTSDSEIVPITPAHWEGERIYRNSIALLLYEAFYHIDPDIEIRLGASVGGNRLIHIENNTEKDFLKLKNQLETKMNELIEQDVIFRQEYWITEEAITYFSEQNQQAAVDLLQSWRNSMIRMVSCGKRYIMSFSPYVPSAGILTNFQLIATGQGLSIQLGQKNLQSYLLNGNSKAKVSNSKQWIKSLGVTSVGEFNQACIKGNVPEIIMVAEGFHEKNISHIAEEILDRNIKIICIAGPSSSGKTTFIKRLKIQLQVNGIKPIYISLDDYYVDREKTVKDENGEYDFEALEALQLNLLNEHLTKLVDGEIVKTARYSFAEGKSYPQGGKKMYLSDDSILLIEGIHGLNPSLIQSVVKEEKLFRIFIQPMTSLLLDNINRVNTSDLRLIRRIVRDRHQRGYGAADNIMRWESVRNGERKHIFPFIPLADVIFDSSLLYETSVLKVYAERYLLEVPRSHPAFSTAYRLRKLIDLFVAIYPDHVPPTSIIREFIGDSGFEY